MNRIVEEEFIRTFIDERHRDALLLELCSERTRRRAVERFACNAEELLDRRQIVFAGSELSPQSVSAALSDIQERTDACYLMFSDWDDGVCLDAADGIAACLDSHGASVVLFGDFAALVKEAGEFDACKKFLLCRRYGGEMAEIFASVARN